MQNSHQTTQTYQYKGRALEDLPANSVTLRVLLPEVTPGALTGIFAPGTTQATVSTTNISGSTESSMVVTANHVVATWVGSSNIAYPPFVRKGEQVTVTQYSNSDKYYWEAEGRDSNLRQIDRHRIQVAAQGPDANGNPVLTSQKDDTNTYFFEMDSENKVIQLKTSKANGEPFAFAIRIDTKNGTVLISDDSAPTPNRILIDSANKQVQFNNSSGTTMSLTDQDIIAYAPRDLLMHAGRQIVIDSPIMTFNRPGSSGVILFNGQALSMSMSADITYNVARFGVTGVTKLNGDVVTGPVRSLSYATGALGSAYLPLTTNIAKGTAALAENTTDTNISGAGDRHAAAFEQVQQITQILAGYLAQINAKIGVPGDTSALIKAGTESELSSVKDT